jgi:serine/threonine protein kinase
MRYEIGIELGRGGMAVVHAGSDAGLERRVALKVLAAHLAGDPAFRQRFLREAKIAGRLLHPNLVRVFDITEVEGLPCIVMELVDGGTLEDGTLTLDEASQVADGLAYAHAHGVVHRDLKPSNLLRGRDGVVKVTDFGIARAMEETRLTQVGTVLGTMRYLPPEQADGRDVGPSADVYSLGVMLSELLVDQTPAVRRLLARCRDEDPERRPTAAKVAADLRAHGRDRTATTAAFPTVARAVSHFRRIRRGPLVALALVLAVLGAVLAILATDKSSPRPAPASRVAPVARSADAAQQARNLTVWLRRYSR